MTALSHRLRQALEQVTLLPTALQRLTHDGHAFAVRLAYGFLHDVPYHARNPHVHLLRQQDCAIALVLRTEPVPLLVVGKEHLRRIFVVDLCQYDLTVAGYGANLQLQQVAVVDVGIDHRIALRRDVHQRVQPHH